MSGVRSEPSPWDAVLFDLDGTLANTIPLIVECFRHAMTVHRPGEAVDEAFVLSQIGRTLKDTMADFSPDAAAADAFKSTYLARQVELHDQMVVPYDGALAEVERYAGIGVPIAIVTSKGREMTGRTLRVCAMDAHFAHVITADDVTRGKPHPQPVLRALDRLGVAPSRRVAFIGDTPWDVEAGKAAGVSTIAVGWGAAPVAALEAVGADHLIHDFAELREIERGWSGAR